MLSKTIERFTLTAALTGSLVLVSNFSVPLIGNSAPKVVTKATVNIEGFQFMPGEVTLKKGGEITFINKDGAPHTFTADKSSPEALSTGRLTKNQSKKIVFKKVGTYSYICDIHPSMMGKIVVVP
jgi:plastocyanin